MIANVLCQICYWNLFDNFLPSDAVHTLWYLYTLLKSYSLNKHVCVPTAPTLKLTLESQYFCNFLWKNLLAVDKICNMWDSESWNDLLSWPMKAQKSEMGPGECVEACLTCSKQEILTKSRERRLYVLCQQLWFSQIFRHRNEQILCQTLDSQKLGVSNR